MSYDPIPATGRGAGLFDQPALFYLTNRALIDEWYALRSTVAESVGEWFRTVVRDDLVREAIDRDLAVSIARGPGSYQHVVLHPSDTTVLNGKPVIGAGFAWPTKSVNPMADSVFSCVRCSRNQTGKNAAAGFLAAGGARARAALGAHGSDSAAWPIWSWSRAAVDWWTDLDTYRSKLVSDVCRLVDAVREPLEAAARVPIVGPADEND